MTEIESPLGKKSSYISHYQPDLLFPIPRQLKRDEIAVPAILPFNGVDIWNGFEISWLNIKGKPVVAMGEFIFPCSSPNIIESKSFKLYLNSFNNTPFESLDKVTGIMMRDLSLAAKSPVQVKLTALADFPPTQIQSFSGVNLDLQDIACDTYLVTPDYLITEETLVSESVFSDLLKSNCLVTGQPDWGSLQIQYTGKKIQHAGLLKYIVSFRNHNEFHEQCVERIFMDILKRCRPEKLTVNARYTRRGGLDINPYRSNESEAMPANIRLCRQ
ncbi:MAG: NADPH-dependent 7-cyano-7-deazaguanine reductase QueF [Gammaproteobacteria bacterium]|nr:NADPH-dependent 7-cyano-7-deazaguanine reductase QueF [Gammaproteobacteria bacterium]